MVELDVTPYTPMLRRLLRSVGIGATLQLLRWKGGCRLCLPRDARRSELTDYLTVAQVDALIAEFGAGTWHTLPKPDKLLLHARNTEIRSDRDSGDSLATLAQRYGLTTRHIVNICAANDDAYDTDADARDSGELF